MSNEDRLRKLNLFGMEKVKRASSPRGIQKSPEQIVVRGAR